MQSNRLFSDFELCRFFVVIRSEEIEDHITQKEAVDYQVQYFSFRWATAAVHKCQCKRYLEYRINQKTQVTKVPDDLYLIIWKQYSWCCLLVLQSCFDCACVALDANNRGESQAWWLHSGLLFLTWDHSRYSTNRTCFPDFTKFVVDQLDAFCFPKKTQCTANLQDFRLWHKLERNFDSHQTL